jgi:protein ImuA
MGLFLPAMEQLSQQGRWQAFIAPPYIPYAPLLEARGIDVQQVLLVHPQSRQDLLWSIEQALRSSTCSAVFAWLGATEFRYSELRKLQLAAAGSDVFSVLFRARQAGRNHAPAALRLEMKEYRRVHILKQRGGNQYLDVNLGVEDDIPGQPQLWELPAYPDTANVQAPAYSA